MRRIEALPGVTSAFASNFVPLDAGGGSGHAIVDGRTVPKGEEPTILFTAVTPHLYKTMGMPLLKGRDFTDAEGAGRDAGGGDQRDDGEEAVAGRRCGGPAVPARRDRAATEWFTVIGVAPDIRMFDMDDDTPDFSVAYVPYRFSELREHRRHDSRGRRSSRPRRRGPQRDSRVGSGAADLQRQDDGGSAARRLLAVPPVRIHVRHLRRGGVVPRRRRRLRRAVVLGLAAHAGNGRAHRARREAVRRARPGRAPGRDARGASAWCSDWSARSASRA